jgi:hypothetical protein
MKPKLMSNIAFGTVAKQWIMVEVKVREEEFRVSKHPSRVHVQKPQISCLAPPLKGVSNFLIAPDSEPSLEHMAFGGHSRPKCSRVWGFWLFPVLILSVKIAASLFNNSLRIITAESRLSYSFDYYIYPTVNETFSWINVLALNSTVSLCSFLY